MEWGINMETEALSELTSIVYLDPNESIFSITEGQLLSLQIGKKFYAKVDLYQAFPFSLDSQYISVRDEKGDEIGMIKDIDVFPPESREAILKELSWRYYSPQVKKIISIKNEFGHLYWDIETDHGFRKFVTRARDEGIYPITNKRLLIVDMSGNRYEIADYHQLDDKSLRLLEPYI